MEGNSEDTLKQAVAKYVTMMSSNVEIFSPSEASMSLEFAAFRSRLPPDEMTNEERVRFPDISSIPQPAEQYFLYLRNKILQLWQMNSREQLTIDACLESIPPPYNDEGQLISRIHAYLERYGYINFGVYTFKNFCPRIKKSIIVIGAGMAGLTVARQLDSLGFDVTVVEARNRVGGRIATYKNENYVAELGAMVVTGLGGNPLMTLAKQIPMELREIKQQCPLFDDTGKPMQKDKDEIIEHEFNRLLEACTYLAHTVNMEDLVGRKMSLGETLETVIYLQEKYVRERHIEHWQAIIAMQKRLISLRLKLNGVRNNIVCLRRIVDKLKIDKDKEQEDPRQTAITDFMWRSHVRDLNIMCDKYEVLAKGVLGLEHDLSDLEKHRPSEVYLSPSERHCLDWHCANLEFANAAPLGSLSLKHWDQDDENEFVGPHLSVQNGFSTAPTYMAEGLNIRYQTVVNEVIYSGSGAEVVVSPVKRQGANSNPDPERLKADAVVCTIPLGLLKKAIVCSADDKTSTNVLKFSPPLPDWKKASIDRLGYGNLNKVVLFFDRIFWDPQQQMFGHVGTTASSRGEMFLFWTLYSTPVLIALISGEAADIAETYDDQTLVHRCVTVLRVIFGSVPQPKGHVVTRWGRDPWSLGTYSYVGINATGDDYDCLAKPIQVPDSEHPTLFFAGEHTCRQHPATVPGAILSGLREAGRIADLHLGPV